MFQHDHGETYTNVRKRLRLPKSSAPEWSHDLHRLWDAYLILERRCLKAEDQIAQAQEVLRWKA